MTTDANGTLTATAGAVTAEGKSGVELAGVVEAQDAITVNSSNGAVNVAQTATLTSNDDSVAVTGKQDVTVASAVIGDDNVTITSNAGNVAVENTATLTANNENIAITADGNIDVNGRSVADDNVTMTAAQGDVTIGATVNAVNDNVEVTATKGTITQTENSGNIVAGTGASLDAKGDIKVDAVYAGYDVDDMDNIAKNANDGVVDVDTKGTLKDYGDDAAIYGDTVALDAAKGVGDANNAISVANATSLTSNTTGDDAGNYMNISKDETVAAGIGELTTTVNASATGANSDVSLVSDGDDAVENITVQNITAADGNVEVTATESSVNVDTVAAKKDVDIAVNDLSAPVNNVSGDDVSLLAEENDVVINSIAATGDANITAEGGNLTDTGNGVAITAAGDVLMAANGYIGDVDGQNPMDVNAGGAIKVDSLIGETDGVWALIRGTSENSSVEYVGAGAPPETVFFNSMVYGGQELGIEYINRAGTELDLRSYVMVDDYNAFSWMGKKSIYFPTTRMFVDSIYGGTSIDFILDGAGRIKLEGIDEQIGPDGIDMNALDDSFTWN